MSIFIEELRAASKVPLPLIAEDWGPIYIIISIHNGQGGGHLSASALVFTQEKQTGNNHFLSRC